jgi:hypothetical protein
MRVLRWFLCTVLVSIPAWALAQAEEEAQPEKREAEAAATFEVLDAKICSGIEGKEAADEKEKFQSGEKAILWLKLRPKGETSMRLRWYVDDQEVWTMDAVPVRLGRTWYNKTLNRPGAWKVEVLDPNDEVLHTATLTVEGEAGGETAAAAPKEAGKPSAPAAAPAEEAEETPAESDHVEVVDLKLAKGLENREPVDEGTTFEAGGRVYTWVKLKVKEDETTIKMRWSIDDKPIFTSEAVTVRRSPNWRTWLTKTLNRAGDWKVEILDADDKPVHAASFTVK